jgi:osmoprotectant transport system permease protein
MEQIGMNTFIGFIQDNGILRLAIEHLYLTGIAMGFAVFVGVSLGILLTRFRWLAMPILGTANVIQTIPSLAILGFMIPLLGIGARPAVAALFLYALLPIIRNTYTSVIGIDPALIESATGMGMTRRQVLISVRLPLALPIIMAGIRTSTVICVGIATLCAFIGAGGLGTLIFRGISMVKNEVILAGAIPAALLALVLDFLLGRLEVLLSPEGFETGR